MKKTISVVGGGSSALLFAAFIDTTKYDVVIYEKKNDIARKFLVAGDGGFNLTHAEPIEAMIEKYTPTWFLKNALLSFTNSDLQNWLTSIGIKTYEGTSHRIFPVKGIKPIEVLNAIKQVINKKKVQIKTGYTWQGFNDDDGLKFVYDGTVVVVKSDIVVFSLGGSSWSITGSDGKWLPFFSEKALQVKPFEASNCAYKILWESSFINKYEGKALKNIEVSCSNYAKKGELVITKYGIEGGAIYALSPFIREQLNKNKKAEIFIDLKPALTVNEIENRLKNNGNKSISKVLKDQIRFSALQIDLLKATLSKEDFIDTHKLAKGVKKMPLIIEEAANIDDAISTVGGIDLNEMNENFECKKLSNHYMIGEMLDWDAPTGGYLLQACFSMGVYVANILNKL